MAAAAMMACACLAGGALAQEKPSGAELPKASEIPDVSPDVLIRADVPTAPSQVLIVSRTSYKPGAKVAKHYHTSQIVFYILQGAMSVKDDGKDPVTIKAGEHLLIKPGTVHEHWNESKTEPLVFVEYVLVDKGQRSAVFVK